VIPRTDPNFLAACRGDLPADLAFDNARVVNVFTRTVEEARVGVFQGRLCAVSDGPLQAARTVDLGGRFLAPGLIDAHMHIESTMLLPREFVALAAPHATTGVVLDPHEIANVLGLPGIRLLMDASDALPMHILYAAPSCVPSSAFEHSGARLEAADLRPLFDDPRVIALAEMMNFPGVVHADSAVLDKLRLGHERGTIDGHAPGLSGRALGAYAGSGISSDHECTTPEEAREKIARGLRVFLREGSAAHNLEALVPVVNDRNAARFCFCTDDRHPDDLQRDGHIDHAIRTAVRLGLDPVTALAMGSLHVAEHYGLHDLGAIAPGKSADLFVFEDLADIRPTAVYWQGEHVAQNGNPTPELTRRLDQGTPQPDDTFARGSVHLPEGFGEDTLALPAQPGAEAVRVIVADPHQLWTEEEHHPPRVEDGHFVADPDRDLLKMGVVARHAPEPGGGNGGSGGGGGVGLGFVRGFGFRNAALASTVGHDAHNLALVGDNDRDMHHAALALRDAGGGQCVVRDGRVLALLPLPIAGLLSDQPASTVIDQQRALLDAARAIGCAMDDPFMPLSFLSLPVIPRLKLTDLGLIDVDAQRVVPLVPGPGSG